MCFLQVSRLFLFSSVFKHSQVVSSFRRLTIDAKVVGLTRSPYTFCAIFQWCLSHRCFCFYHVTVWIMDNNNKFITLTHTERGNQTNVDLISFHFSIWMNLWLSQQNVYMKIYVRQKFNIVISCYASYNNIVFFVLLCLFCSKNRRRKIQKKNIFISFRWSMDQWYAFSNISYF